LKHLHACQVGPVQSKWGKRKRSKIEIKINKNVPIQSQAQHYSTAVYSILNTVQAKPGNYHSSQNFLHPSIVFWNDLEVGMSAETCDVLYISTKILQQTKKTWDIYATNYPCINKWHQYSSD